MAHCVLVVPVVLILAALCWPLRAHACATCSVGDRTLTSMGAAQPYPHRVRVSLGVRHRQDGVGTAGVDALELRELRLELAAAYSPTRWLTLSLLAPVLRRDVLYANLARSVSWDMGDLDMVARAVVFRDRAFAPRHLLSALVGLEVPTARAQRDGQGQVLPLELQPGSGSWDPSLGLSYAHFADPWSVYVSSVLSLPTRGFDDSRGGASWRTVAEFQVQPTNGFGIRMGGLVRVDAVSQENGAAEPDSGGTIAFGTMGLVASPTPDLIFQAGIAVPVWNALTGQHREGLALHLGVSLDL
jgi:hypothetical protein